MNSGLLIFSGWIAVSVVMSCLWLIQKSTRNAGIVDVAWAFGTGVLGAFFAWGVLEGDPSRRLMVGLMAAIWGGRLGFYLAARVLREEEDGRYQKLRAQWGNRVQVFLFLFFQIQALWAIIFSVPMFAAASNPTPGIRWFDLVGILIWVVSMVGESIADRQLARFRSNPANQGKVCATGLWRYSRHPNYFFESIHWWAYLFIAWGSPYWWIAICGPFVMLFFIFKVTGIPPTESRALESRGDAYRRYQETTSALFPWPPKEAEKES